MEYKEQIKKYNTYSKDDLGLACLTLGLVGETEELWEKANSSCNELSESILLELGDIYWYITMLFDYLHIDISYQKSRYKILKHTYPNYYPDLQHSVSSFAEKIKKKIRDKKKIWLELVNNLEDILIYFILIVEVMPFTLEQVKEKNIEKLESRYNRNVIHGEGDFR